MARSTPGPSAAASQLGGVAPGDRLGTASPLVMRDFLRQTGQSPSKYTVQVDIVFLP